LTEILIKEADNGPDSHQVLINFRTSCIQHIAGKEIAIFVYQGRKDVPDGLTIYTTMWYLWSLETINKEQMNRREFIKKSAGYAAYAAFGMTAPAMFKGATVPSNQSDMIVADDLLEALEASDVARASKLLREKLSEGGEALEIHLSLFPVVQRVLNPPFINPHLPKMYGIYRELVPYLRNNEIPALIHLEVTEYARRPKLKELPKAKLLNASVSFSDVEAAIGDQDWEKTAVLMATFHAQEGGLELARRLLLLGSGYLDQSLGHSISCTAFILLEMLERTDQDPWPALATLGDYFCKGRFHTTPVLRKSKVFPSDEVLNRHLLRATSGSGIVNLHHTITLYAVERTRQFFSKEEYNHMLEVWTAFMDDKKAEPIALDSPRVDPPANYPRFYETFSGLEAKPTVAIAAGMIGSPTGRRQLGRFLIKSLCDKYQGNYNPHYLTGLGSTLWVVDRYWNQESIVLNALFQYLTFFGEGIK
jgi:hypothetical protein